MSKEISIFVSYAHANRKSAIQLIELLSAQLKASKNYNYTVWFDDKLTVGESWEKQILEARDSCSLGLLLISPSFLSSKFIVDKEIPIFIGDDALPSVPVMLQPVDFERHNLRGLKEKQIFRLNGKAFYEYKSKRRLEFSFELFKSIEDKLSVN